MEIVITLEPWPDDSPVSHDSTKFYIKDPDKSVVAEDTVDGLLYIKEIDIPVGETYYVIAERQFSLKDAEYDISNINYLSEEFPITNNEDEISNMLLAKPVVIEKPTVFFNKKDMVGEETTVTIKSSSYRGSGDGHTHTHWVLVGDSSIIYTSLKDTVNKTSLTIEKTLLSSLSKLEIVCIHCSNNIESEISRLNVRFNTLNFVLTSNLVNVPISNYSLVIEKLDTTELMRLTKIDISHDTELLKSYDVTNIDISPLTFYLQSSMIEPGRYLNIEVYGYDNSGTLGKKSYILQPISVSYEDNINKDYEYTKKFTNNIINTVLPVGIVTDNLNSAIYIPETSNLSLYTVGTNGDLTKYKSIPALAHLGTLDNMYIKYNNDNTILIDCLDGNEPTFMVYQHNIILDTYVFVHMLKRTDEITTVTMTNAIEQINNDEFIYSVYGSNELKKYNKKTNVITALLPIPLEGVSSSTVLKMDDSNLLVLPNKDHQTFIYNISKNEYSTAMAIPYSEFIGVDLKKVDLINGDKLIISNENTEESTVAYFDISDYTLTKLSTKINSFGNLALFKSYNNVYIANTIVKDYIEYDYDRMNVVLFQ